MGENLPVPRFETLDLNPDETRRKLKAIAEFQAIIRNTLAEGHDYGVIPGTGNKPTLLKPGAEKIAKLLNCFDDYEIVEKVEDWDRPLFRYLVRCTLSDMASGTKISSGMGECNSFEVKYRFRWVLESQIPAGLDKAALRSRDTKRVLFEFEFALEKRETTGQYGKPAEHWALFDKAIADGTARRVQKKTKKNKEFPGYEIDVGAKLYHVENPDIFDQVNTILKMAKKRALVDAALSAGRLSDLFTQDLEDLVEAAPEAEPNGEIVVEAAPAKAPPPAARKPSAPLKDVKDEFSGDDDDEGVPVGGASVEQIAEIAKRAKVLVEMGVEENKVYNSMRKRIYEKHGIKFAETSELTAEIADECAAYLNRWAKKIREEDAAKAKAAAGGAR